MLRYAITGGTYSRPSDGSKAGPDSAPLKTLRAPLLDAFSSPAPNANLHKTRFLAQIRRVAEWPVDFIQLREKDLAPATLADLARQILAVFAETASPSRLLLHSAADVAIATRAHGVHLPSAPGGLLPGQIRRLYRHAALPDPVISRSCHGLRELAAILPQQPDLILFSPIFGKSRAGDLVAPAIGLEALRTACSLAHPIPVLALGGVTLENISACVQHGASGMAGIRVFDL